MTYDINPQWGSHLTTLRSVLERVPPEMLIIEHGCGLYSSPVIAAAGREVVVVEEAPGWRGWAEWYYAHEGRQIRTIAHAKHVREYLGAAGLVFIDGKASERGDLLAWSLEAGVPVIVAHDTEPDHAKLYGYRSHLFSAPGYVVAHDEQRPRTTLWVKA